MASLGRQAGYSLRDVKELAADDSRASEPLYTVQEAALFLGMRPGTLRDWMQGLSRSRPLVHVVEDRGQTFIPFIGLAEAAVTTILRRGLSAQYIRRALDRLQDELGMEYALASKDLYLHGARILYDYLEPDGSKKLVEVVSGNAVFRPVVKEGLQRIEYGDGYATSLVLPKTQWELVSVDPRWASGQPLTINGGARLVDLLRRFGAGEDALSVAEDYGVPPKDMLELIRAFYRAPEGPGPEASRAA